MIVELESDCWRPTTADEKAAVIQELERVLRHPYFSQSKRYPQFLRFVVSQALEDESDSIKERVLGFQVFGRAPDYDTAADPVVRVTATEIRKRLALYYQEPEHQTGIRITLPLGSYSPRFQQPEEIQHSDILPTPELVQTLVGDEAVTEAEEFPSTKTEAKYRRASNSWLSLVVVLPILAVLVFAAVWSWRLIHRSNGADFWAPVIAAKGTLLICLPDQTNNSALPLGDASDPRRQSIFNVNRNEAAMTDLPPLVNVVGIMQSHNRSFHLKGTTSTSLEDLRQGPSVLIGSFSNPWTLRFTESMRFHFANDPEMKELWIEDRQNPHSKQWIRSTSHRGKEAYYEDYALLVRFADPDTGQLVVVAAGLGHGGTLAAGEFLASPSDMEELMRRSPKDWKGQNIEAVLKTSVVGDQAGTPHIVAAHFW